LTLIGHWKMSQKDTNLKNIDIKKYPIVSKLKKLTNRSEDFLEAIINNNIDYL
jgi:hypothetical protein